MWRRVIVGILLLALLGSGGWLAYERFFRAYAITRRLHPGEQWRYQITQSFQIGSQAITVNLALTETIKKINPDGSALLERVLQGDPHTLQALRQGAEPLGEIPTRTLWQIYPDGRETPLSGERPRLLLGPASAQILPERPMRLGEQWRRESYVGSIKTRFACRLEGFATVDGASCYKIVTQIESLPGSLPQLQGTLTSYIDRESGWVRQEEGTIQMVAGALQMSSQVRIHGQRVREGTSGRG
ncbi:MAG: hypothetical protein ABDI19_11890 [Armatimonadota bacterium]